MSQTVRMYKGDNTWSFYVYDDDGNPISAGTESGPEPESGNYIQFADGVAAAGRKYDESKHVRDEKGRYAKKGSGKAKKDLGTSNVKAKLKFLGWTDYPKYKTQRLNFDTSTGVKITVDGTPDSYKVYECVDAWNDVDESLRKHVKNIKITDDDYIFGAWNYDTKTMTISMQAPSPARTLHHEFGHVTLMNLYHSDPGTFNAIIDKFGSIEPLTDYAAEYRDPKNEKYYHDSGVRVLHHIQDMADLHMADTLGDVSITDKEWRDKAYQDDLAHLLEDWGIDRSNISTKGIENAKWYHGLMTNMYAHEQFAEFIGVLKTGIPPDSYIGYDEATFNEMKSIYEKIMPEALGAAGGQVDMVLQQLDDIAAAFRESDRLRDERGRWTRGTGSDDAKDDNSSADPTSRQFDESSDYDFMTKGDSPFTDEEAGNIEQALRDILPVEEKPERGRYFLMPNGDWLNVGEKTEHWLMANMALDDAGGRYTSIESLPRLMYDFLGTGVVRAGIRHNSIYIQGGKKLNSRQKEAVELAMIRNRLRTSDVIMDFDDENYEKKLTRTLDVGGSGDVTSDIVNQLDSLAAAWDESKVNRDEIGRFAEKPGSKAEGIESQDMNEYMRNLFAPQEDTDAVYPEKRQGFPDDYDNMMRQHSAETKKALSNLEESVSFGVQQAVGDTELGSTDSIVGASDDFWSTFEGVVKMAREEWYIEAYYNEIDSALKLQETLGSWGPAEYGIIRAALAEAVTTNNVSEDLDRIFPGLRQLSQIPAKVNEAYELDYAQASSLYRGTDLLEIDEMIQSGTLGSYDKSQYTFKCVTSSRPAADNFAEKSDLRQYEETGRDVPQVVISYDKDYLDQHIVKQGYDFFERGDSKKIDVPQGVDMMYEMEYRIPHESVQFDPSRITLHFDEHMPEEQRAEIEAKYGMFKDIQYDLYL